MRGMICPSACRTEIVFILICMATLTVDFLAQRTEPTQADAVPPHNERTRYRQQCHVLSRMGTPGFRLSLSVKLFFPLVIPILADIDLLLIVFPREPNVAFLLRLMNRPVYAARRFRLRPTLVAPRDSLTDVCCSPDSRYLFDKRNERVRDFSAQRAQQKQSKLYFPAQRTKR